MGRKWKRENTGNSAFAEDQKIEDRVEERLIKIS
jgi:hypothetical protein